MLIIDNIYYIPSVSTVFDALLFKVLQSIFGSKLWVIKDSWSSGNNVWHEETIVSVWQLDTILSGDLILNEFLDEPN